MYKVYEFIANGSEDIEALTVVDVLKRAGVDIVKHAEGSDPGAVVYDALEAAKARECDVVIIDTAGRLHNKKNLMDELAKINRIIDSKAGDCSREVLLVLDATTGQNAVNQAKLFSETAPITGIVLTKLDGTAKGGIVISIKNELGIPVKLIGVGEKIDDLQPFDSRTFVEALFSDVETEEDLEEAENAEGEYSEEDFGEEDAPEAAEEAEDETEEPESENEAEPQFTESQFSFGTVPETAHEAVPVAEPEPVSVPADNEDEDDSLVTNEPVEDGEEMISETGYTYNENYMDSFEDDNAAETEDEESESYETADENEEAPAETEKKKKRGFFSRLFGRKKYDDEEEYDESEYNEEEESDEDE